jgi:hypothetical protein
MEEEGLPSHPELEKKLPSEEAALPLPPVGKW